MATITIRIDDTIRDALEDYAHTHDISVSEVLRDAIDELLGRNVGMKRTDVPASLNMVDRKVLALLHEVLRRLPSEEYEPGHHKVMEDVLDCGYSAEYADVFAAVEPELSRAECEVVWDIFDMFRVLQSSLDTLSDEERAALGDDTTNMLQFKGLDLNDNLEGRLLGYARHLLHTERWTELKPLFDEAHDGGNSHGRFLPAYRRMLAVYKPIFKDRIRARGYSDMFLSADELRGVADAWPHPASR